MDAKTAARIEALRHSLGWEDLQAEFERQEEKYWNAHIADVKDPKKRIDEIQLARDMGKLDGIRAILRAPEKAAVIMLREQEGNNE